MAFTYGQLAFLICPMRYRATAVLVPRPSPEAILTGIQRHRATSLYAVPTAFQTMLQEVRKYDLSSLRKCSSAGEPLRIKLWEDWYEATGTKIVNGIGTTETLTHFIAETLDVERPGSIGRPVPGFTVRVIDDDGNPLPFGQRGRLAVRGPTGGRYLDDIDRQKGFVRNGWNITGDIVEQDRDGRFWYAERADDMIVSAGYNISAQEVESIILDHPKVADCAVVAVADPTRGHIVRACIVLRDLSQDSDETAREIQDFVKETVAPYKYPRDIKFLENLPRTATGKIQRFRLRQL